MEKPSDSHNIVKNAFFMAIGTLLSRVLGLVRDVAFAAYFPKFVTDAWVVGFRLPNLFRRLLGEGSMSASFIPVFIRVQNQEKDPEKAKELVSGVATFLLVVVFILTIVCLIWMEEIMGFLVSGPGYTEIQGKQELTVRMARIMFPFIALMSFYALFMAILNSHKKFALAAFAPCLLNVALITAAVIPFGDQMTKALMQSWAVIVGGILQMGVLIPTIWRLGFFPRLSFSFKSAAIRDVFKGMVPSMMGMSIVQFTGMVSVYYASFLGEGTMSNLYYADRVMELPLSLFAVSLGTALLPTLSQLWATNQREKMLQVSSQHLQLIFFISVPCALGIYFLGHPIAQVLFQRGHFGAEDSENLAAILRVDAFTVLVASGVRVLAPSFYAIKNTWLPALSSLIALIVHIFLAPKLMDRFGFVGLPMSTVVSSAVNLATLYASHLKMIGSLRSFDLIKSFIKFSVCGGVMVLIIEQTKPFYYQSDGFFNRVIWLTIIIGIAATTYFVSASLIRVREANIFLNTVKRKFLARLKP